MSLVLRKLIGAFYVVGLLVFVSFMFYAITNGFSVTLNDPDVAHGPVWLTKVLMLTWFLSWAVHGIYMAVTGTAKVWPNALGTIAYFVFMFARAGGIPHITPDLELTTLAGIYLIYLVPVVQFMDLASQVSMLPHIVPVPAEP